MSFPEIFDVCCLWKNSFSELLAELKYRQKPACLPGKTYFGKETLGAQEDVSGDVHLLDLLSYTIIQYEIDF